MRHLNIWAVLSWFNNGRTTKTQLSSRQEVELEAIRSLPINNAHRINRICNQVDNTRTMDIIAQRAELLANLSVLLYEDGERNPVYYIQARECITEAVELLGNNSDTYQRIVVQLIRFAILEALDQYWYAAESLVNAHNTFTKIVNFDTDSIDRTRVRSVTTELLTSPVNCMPWINKKQNTILCTSAEEMRRSIWEIVERGSYNDPRIRTAVMNQMDCMVAITSEMEKEQTGQAYIYNGIANWIMGQRSEAIDCMRIASEHYEPESHEKTFIHWIKGLMQYNACMDSGNPPDKTEIGQIINSLEHCARSVHTLRNRASYSKQVEDQENVSWYRSQEDAMQNILSTLVTRVRDIWLAN